MPRGVYTRKPFTEEAKRNMGLASKGRHFSEEAKNKLRLKRLERKKRLGYLNSPETRMKISLGNKGKKRTEEQLRQMRIRVSGERNPFFGKRHSEESKKKMRLKAAGHQPCLGRKASLKSRLKMSLAHIGKYAGNKNPSWKGGITPSTNKRVNSLEWKKLRKEVYKRDDYTCQACHTKYYGINRKRLHSHHIVPYNISHDDSKENLITYCNKCHIKEERKYYLSNPHIDLEEVAMAQAG